MIPFKKLPFTKEQVFVIGCTHYNHKNICKATTSWESGYRDFDSLTEMNQALVNGINNKVKETDCLIQLGDWSFSGPKSAFDFRIKLNCKTVYAVIGNHCQHIQANTLIQISEEEAYDAKTRLGLTIQFDKDSGEYSIYSKDLFTEINDLFYYQVEDKKFIGAHYPLLSWFHARAGVYQLHSHEHGMLNYLNENCKRLDAGVDSYFKMFGKYEPFSFLEIEKIMDKKEFLALGHHV